MSYTQFLANHEARMKELNAEIERMDSIVYNTSSIIDSNNKDLNVLLGEDNTSSDIADISARQDKISKELDELLASF